MAAHPTAGNDNQAGMLLWRDFCTRGRDTMLSRVSTAKTSWRFEEGRLFECRSHNKRACEGERVVQGSKSEALQGAHPIDSGLPE